MFVCFFFLVIVFCFYWCSYFIIIYSFVFFVLVIFLTACMEKLCHNNYFNMFMICDIFRNRTAQGDPEILHLTRKRSVQTKPITFKKVQRLWILNFQCFKIKHFNQNCFRVKWFLSLSRILFKALTVENSSSARAFSAQFAKINAFWNWQWTIKTTFFIHFDQVLSWMKKFGFTLTQTNQDLHSPNRTTLPQCCYFYVCTIIVIIILL